MKSSSNHKPKSSSINKSVQSEQQGGLSEKSLALGNSPFQKKEKHRLNTLFPPTQNSSSTVAPVQKTKKKKESNSQNPQEEKIRNAFDEVFNKESKVKGEGKEGADVAVSDNKNIWIAEAKGKDNNWMSTDNISKDGNVPSKQIMSRLKGFVKHELLFKSELYSDETKDTLANYIIDSDLHKSGYANLLLATTGLDVNDALLGINIKKGEGVKSSQDDFFPLTISSVFAFIDNCLEKISEEKLTFKENEFKVLKKDWEKFEGNGREWFINHSKEAHEMERLYTLCRKAADHEIRNDYTWKKLSDEEEEVRLLPVISIDKDLENMKKLKKWKQGNEDE